MLGVLLMPFNKKSNPVNAGFLGSHAVMQIPNSLIHLIEDFRRLQRQKRDATLPKKSVTWSKISFHTYDENRDFGMCVYRYK